MILKYIQIITTTPTKKDAEKITNIIVEKRLGACAQIVGPIISTYWWKGKIEKSEEWQCIIKSKKKLYNKVEKIIKKVHTYDVPEIISIPIINGNKEYLKWLDGEVGLS